MDNCLASLKNLQIYMMVDLHIFSPTHDYDIGLLLVEILTFHLACTKWLLE